MMQKRGSFGRVLGTLRGALGWSIVLWAVAGTGAGAEAEVSYSNLSPILAQRCLMCHTGEFAPGGLALDTFDALMMGSARGPVVLAGNPSESELIRRIKGITQPRMPMTGPPFLSESEIGLFERWVVAGMPEGVAGAEPAPSAPVQGLPGPGEAVNYLHVAPILAQRCAKCHTEQGLMGPAPEGYLLTSYPATLAPADRVRVVPGNPAASELVRRIRGQAHPMMPFDGPPFLSAEEIRLIEQWIAQGAPDAEGVPAAVPVGAKLRLHGTLGERWSLDGLPLQVDGGTRLDKAPGVGDYVEVRGRLDASGGIRVDRLRRR